MDVGLPVGDGISATRSLRADPRTENTPIIMLTGRTRSEDIIRGLEAGAQEYVLKPFEIPELIARVRTLHRLATDRRNLDRVKTQLEAEVDRKTKRLQLLNDFMREMNRAGSRGQILDLVIHSVQRMSSARRLSLLMVDVGGESLRCERAVGIDPAVVEKIKINTAQGIAGQVFQSGKTLAARSFGVGGHLGTMYNRDAFVSTPLVSSSFGAEDRIMGVLNVTEKSDDTTFSDDEVECIRSIADAAAIALDNAMRQEQLSQSVRVLLQTVGHLAEYRDEETTLHIERVSRLARILAVELAREGPCASSVTDNLIESLVQAAPMHDIGKVGIPDEILTKPGRLTDEEFQIMKTHTDIGRRVLSRALDPAHPVPLLQMCIDIAYCHHERYDGTGYPRRIAGDAIPLSARIITLVDAYDAITSHRRYKSAKGHEQAVGIIRSETGRHFDPILVDAFLRCHEQFDEVRMQCAERSDTLTPAAVA